MNVKNAYSSVNFEIPALLLASKQAKAMGTSKFKED